MIDSNGSFLMCAECSCKEKLGELRKDEYYCRYATNVFPNGIVTADVDATNCIKQGWYCPISSESLNQ